MHITVVVTWNLLSQRLDIDIETGYWALLENKNEIKPQNLLHFTLFAALSLSLSHSSFREVLYTHKVAHSPSSCHDHIKIFIFSAKSDEDDENVAREKRHEALLMALKNVQHYRTWFLSDKLGAQFFLTQF